MLRERSEPKHLLWAKGHFINTDDTQAVVMMFMPDLGDLALDGRFK